MLTITPEDPASFDALELMKELSMRLAEITGDSGQSSFDPNDVRAENARFVVARNHQGRALGCGGFRPLQNGVAELKRMYSRPGTSGVGSAVLEFLEGEAKTLGYQALWLETRVINQRAVSFYERREYKKIPNFGKYVGNPNAVCFEKWLTRRSGETAQTVAMSIREFRLGDEPALHAVYHSAIHQIAMHDYTSEQINAWAPETLDRDVWETKMRKIKPFVAVSGDAVIGYADVQANGYIDHFFVSGTCSRQGVGRLLMEKIHDTAKRLGLTELSSDVSRTAQPFFAHFGFDIVAQRSPVVRGIVVPNAAMRKDLVANPALTR